MVYGPVCHWVWGGGWLGEMGVLDFAGGTVVHINAGVAGLVAAIVLGKRSGYPKSPMKPSNLVLTMVGAAMLWVGWFGFNAGSELAADGTAGMAMAVTQIATAAAALGWMFVEWMSHGKPSALGDCDRRCSRPGCYHTCIRFSRSHGSYRNWRRIRFRMLFRRHYDETCLRI